MQFHIKTEIEDILGTLWIWTLSHIFVDLVNIFGRLSDLSKPIHPLPPPQKKSNYMHDQYQIKYIAPCIIFGTEATR